MQQYSINIDAIKLSRLLQATFEQLPRDYFKGYKSFLKSRSKTFFRESLISRLIAIPASNNVIFKNFDATYRLKNIIIPTINNTKTELQIYLNQNGIIGISIREDLENLIIDNTDAKQFIIEKVPTSKFLTDIADLEYLDGFSEIGDYLDNQYASEVFTINDMQYYSIITLSDKNCIAIDNKNSVYLLNKVSGLIKIISKHPGEFIKAFKDDTLNWVFEL